MTDLCFHCGIKHDESEDYHIFSLAGHKFITSSCWSAVWKLQRYMLNVSTNNWGGAKGQKWDHDDAFPSNLRHLNEAVITVKEWADVLISMCVCAGGAPNKSRFSFCNQALLRAPSSSYTWFGKVTSSSCVRARVCMCRFHKSSVQREHEL